MISLDINTLEGWTNQKETLAKIKLKEQNSEPAIKEFPKTVEEPEISKEQAALDAIAQEVANIYMHATISQIPMEEIQAICKIINKLEGIHSDGPTLWNSGAVYLYGYMQGIRKERGRRNGK